LDDSNDFVLELLAAMRSALCQTLGYVLSEFVLSQLLEFYQAVITDQIFFKDQIRAKPRKVSLAKDAFKTSIGHTNAKAFHGDLHFV
jgi:hypothetical protein